jgi:hypothetical protein
MIGEGWSTVNDSQLAKLIPQSLVRCARIIIRQKGNFERLVILCLVANLHRRASGIGVLKDISSI